MKKILLLTGLIAILAGCQKNQSIAPKSAPFNQLSTKQVDVGTLTNYLAKLTSLKPGTIAYNAGTKQFAAFGRDQISLDELTNLYNRIPESQVSKKNSGNFTTTYVPCTNCGGGGTNPPPPPPPPPAPQPTPFSDPADSLLSYSNSLINYSTTSSTIYENGINTPLSTDVTQGAVISYTIAITGTGGGSISGNNLNVKYNQSQAVKVTVQISVPHDPNTNKVSPFTINATLELFTGNRLFPTPIPPYGIQITEKNVKATDIVTSLSFNLTFPVATPSLNGQHFSLYWNNATSDTDEKLTLDPVYTIVVLGLPNTTGVTVTEQPGPIIYFYRMFYAPGGEHFYTSSNIEKYQLLHSNKLFDPSFWSYLFGNGTNHYWTDEGNIGQMYNFKAQGTVPLYRLFNGSVHMYTIDPNERANIIATLGYHDEGISGYVFSTAVAGTQPVYRYRGTTATGHFFTTNYNEIGSGSGYGFVYEGVAYYDLSNSGD